MLIGLTGPAGSGKNAVADILCRRHKFFQIGFADPVYKAVAAITGLSDQQLRDRRVKETTIEWLGKSPRELLQLLGTEFGRNMIRDTIWIDRAFHTIDAYRKYARMAAPVVITDLRFPNEAQAVKSRGGLVVLVSRSGAGLSGAAGSHSSEAGIDPAMISLTITNDGTLADLQAAVDATFPTLQTVTMEL